MTSNVGGLSYTYPTKNIGTTSYLAHGTTVTLTATAAAGSAAAWTTCSGIAAGNGTPEATCTYSSLDWHKTAEATFTLNTCTVTPSGSGGGILTGNGIDCVWNGSSSSGTCKVSLGYNTAVSLVASPGAGSTFNGWSGGTGSAAGCGGTGACAFAFLESSGVEAPFTKVNHIHLPLIVRPESFLIKALPGDHPEDPL